ncbi:hypothetical protein KOW79_006183 [Hemibagrus wyckioides]|uniref:Uncharacterized protein n=1 Tax=Hemibagrus wyckioides TaxID=337641 RepID=A0A9D3SM93_9TELE|nr:hypothetical protein KOW79_006183 [Hemibagrus wyckioides]
MRELSTTHWVTVDLSPQWFTTRFRECQAKGLPYLSRKEASIKAVALPLQPTSEEEEEEEPSGSGTEKEREGETASEEKGDG